MGLFPATSGDGMKNMKNTLSWRCYEKFEEYSVMEML
jgi:hypothetical protein